VDQVADLQKWARENWEKRARRFGYPPENGQ